MSDIAQLLFKCLLKPLISFILFKLSSDLIKHLCAIIDRYGRSVIAILFRFLLLLTLLHPLFHIFDHPHVESKVFVAIDDFDEVLQIPDQVNGERQEAIEVRGFHKGDNVQRYKLETVNLKLINDHMVREFKKFQSIFKSLNKIKRINVITI